MDNYLKPFVKPIITEATQMHTVQLRGGYIPFWEPRDAIAMPNGLSAAAFQQDKLSILELKGHSATGFSFDLFAGNHTCWLVFSFLGLFSVNGGMAVDPGHYTICSIGTDWTSCRLDATGKAWMLMLGIPNDRQAALQEEWPQLTEGTPQRIGYRQQQVLKKLQQVQRKPYSTTVKLHEIIVQFLGLFHADMADAQKYREVEQLALYHRAVAYIRKHYLDAEIDRNRIAEALHVSVRTLNRAFEGKTNNIITTIRMVRLHKARDLVRSTDMSIEDIAFQLHYTDAKHLSKKYQALFHRSPAQERKIAAERRKKPGRG